MNKSLKRYVMCQLDGWMDTEALRQLTVSLSAFGKQEDQQLPDEPHPGDKKEKENSWEII